MTHEALIDLAALIFAMDLDRYSDAFSAEKQLISPQQANSMQNNLFIRIITTESVILLTFILKLVAEDLGIVRMHTCPLVRHAVFLLVRALRLPLFPTGP